MRLSTISLEVAPGSFVSIIGEFGCAMTTLFDDTQRLVILDPAARRGDYIEPVAEIDAIVALSACPGDCNGGRNKPLTATVYTLGDA